MPGRIMTLAAGAVTSAALLVGTAGVAQADPAPPDLAVTGQIPATVTAGRPFTSSYTVTNNGGSASDAAVWQEPLNSPFGGATFVSASPGCEVVENPTPHFVQLVVECPVPQLEPGQAHDLQVTLQLDSAGPVEVGGGVFAANEVDHFDDNSFTAQVTATEAPPPPPGHPLTNLLTALLAPVLALLGL